MNINTPNDSNERRAAHDPRDERKSTPEKGRTSAVGIPVRTGLRAGVEEVDRGAKPIE